MNTSEMSIGVFDSGLGGLTAVKELMKVLPHENIVYFGDTGRVPYGNRSRETIIKYARQDVNFLMSHNVKAIIAACGTVSSVATELYRTVPVAFTGVLEPTAKYAASSTKNSRIGVIGTTATINSHSYRDHIAALNSGIEVFERDCPLFVPLVENGFTDPEDEIVRCVVERYTRELREKDVDTVILGCTHYPILKEAIQQSLPGVTLVDSGRATALHTAELLREKSLLSSSDKPGSYRFYVSDTPDNFENLAGVFLQKNISHTAEQIDIEQY